MIDVEKMIKERTAILKDAENAILKYYESGDTFDAVSVCKRLLIYENEVENAMPQIKQKVEKDDCITWNTEGI